MKNSTFRLLLSLFPVLLGLVIVLGACSENVNSPITKRQHRKGFHVDFAHKVKRAPALQAEKVEERKMPKSEASVVEDEDKQPIYASADKDFTVLAIPKDVLNENLVSLSPLQAVRKIMPIKSVLKDMAIPVKKAKKMVTPDDDDDDDALSLLWLIIVVILILWLLGYLSGGLGLGGLIHLLLLIALILFILWILKII